MTIGDHQAFHAPIPFVVAPVAIAAEATLGRSL